MPKLVDVPTLRTEVRRVLRLVAAKTRRPAPEPLDVYPHQRRLSLLLKWVQAVGSLHGLRVVDFSSSFGDGRALCYLVRGCPIVTCWCRRGGCWCRGQGLVLLALLFHCV